LRRGTCRAGASPPIRRADPRMAAGVPRRLANFGIRTLAAVLGIALLAGGALLLVRAVPEEKFVEYRMSEPQDAPIAIAAGNDGSIWFTIDHADAIGRVRNGRIERLPTSSRNIEPLGLAVAADGSAWYTDLAARGITRISSVGEIARFVLDTPITRLGRLAIAPDGAAWFADPTGYGMTRLKDGVFTRYQIESARGGPGFSPSSSASTCRPDRAGQRVCRPYPQARTRMRCGTGPGRISPCSNGATKMPSGRRASSLS